MPESLDLVDPLRADGVPAVVSGAGPTVLAFTDAAGADARCSPAARDGWAGTGLAIGDRRPRRALLSPTGGIVARAPSSSAWHRRP